MSDYLKLSAAALSAYKGYEANQADTSSDKMAEFYRKCAGDMLAKAQAMAILAMAEAVVYPPVTVTTERTENARLSAKVERLEAVVWRVYDFFAQTSDVTESKLVAELRAALADEARPTEGD